MHTNKLEVIAAQLYIIDLEYMKGIVNFVKICSNSKTTLCCHGNNILIFIVQILF